MSRMWVSWGYFCYDDKEKELYGMMGWCVWFCSQVSVFERVVEFSVCYLSGDEGAFEDFCKGVIQVETNQLFGRNSNVIFTRQTCSHRCRGAGSKHRALVFYCSVRNLYVFLISKCRWELYPGLCMTLVLAQRMRPRSADFRRILRPNTFLNQKSALRSHILFASTKVAQT